MLKVNLKKAREIVLDYLVVAPPSFEITEKTFEHLDEDIKTAIILMIWENTFIETVKHNLYSNTMATLTIKMMQNRSFFGSNKQSIAGRIEANFYPGYWIKQEFDPFRTEIILSKLMISMDGKSYTFEEIKEADLLEAKLEYGTVYEFPRIEFYEDM